MIVKEIYVKFSTELSVLRFPKLKKVIETVLRVYVAVVVIVYRCPLNAQKKYLRPE